MYIKQYRYNYLLLLRLVMLFVVVKSQGPPNPCTDNAKKIGCYFKDEACQKDSSDADSCIICPSGEFVNFEFQCAETSHPCDKTENKRWECVEKGKTCKRDTTTRTNGECVPCDESKKLNFDGVCTGKSHPCDKSETKRWECLEEGETCKRDFTHPETTGICVKCVPSEKLNFDGVCTTNETHPCDADEMRWNCYSNKQKCVRDKTDFWKGKCEKCPSGKEAVFDARCSINLHPCDKHETRLKCYVENKTCVRHKDNYKEYACEPCADGKKLNFDGRCNEDLHLCDYDIERLKCYLQNKTCVRQRGRFEKEMCDSCKFRFLNFDGRCSNKLHPCDDEEVKWKCYVQNAECVRQENNFYEATCKTCPKDVKVNFDARCIARKHPCDDEKTRLECYLKGETCTRMPTDYERSICVQCETGKNLNFDGICHDEKHPCDNEIERLNCYLKNGTCRRSKDNFKLATCEPCEVGVPRFDGRCTEIEHPCDSEMERLKCYLDGKTCVRSGTKPSEKECKSCEAVLNFDGRCAETSHPCDEGRERKWECNEKNEECIRDPNQLKIGECRPCPNNKPILNFDGICSAKRHPCDKGEKEREKCHQQVLSCVRKIDDPLMHECKKCPPERQYLNFDGSCSDEKHPCDQGEAGLEECNANGRKCTRDSRNFKLHQCGACLEGKSFINFDGICSEEPHPCDDGQIERYKCHKIGEQCLRKEDDPKKSRCVKCPEDEKYLNFDGKCGAQPHPCDEEQRSRFICNNEGKECTRSSSDKNRHECLSCENGKFLNFDGKCSDEKHPCDEGNVGKGQCDAMGFKCRGANTNPHKYECIECPEAKPYLNFDGICAEEKHDCDDGGKGKVHCYAEKKLCKRDEKDIKLYRCVDCLESKIFNFDGTCSDEKHPCDEGQEGKKTCDKAKRRCKRNEKYPKSFECVSCPPDKTVLNFDGLCTEQVHPCDEGQEGRKECMKEKNECRRDPAAPSKYKCVKCSEGRRINKEGRCDVTQTGNNAIFLHHKCLEELSPIFLIIIAFVVRFTRKLFL